MDCSKSVKIWLLNEFMPEYCLNLIEPNSEVPSSWLNDDKFGLNPFAGVLLGYGINRTGMYLQPDLNSIAEAESKKYLANYQVGCEFYFLSDSQFKFSLIPIYRASFKEVVYTDLIRNRYKSIGLQLGISYNF